jgi:hypothetical protein
MGFFGRINNGLPTKFAQVLGPFQAAQHGNASTGRPVVGNDEYFFAGHGAKIGGKLEIVGLLLLLDCWIVGLFWTLDESL